MASVRVAVRVRPLSQREKDLSAKVIIQVDGHKTSVLNMKENYHCMNEESFGESTKSFSYDFSYDSINSTSANFVTQEKIFEDLGTDVLQSAFEGYNACVFAYGQTGSGKSYTMMGNPDDYGLIPRICEGLFHQISGVLQKDKASFHMEVSYFEIYNERVRDLLPRTETRGCELKVREHPKDGPYVEALSRRHVQNYTEVDQLMQEGNRRRATASTGMNHVSSRSHAIFTIRFIKAMFDAELPSETVSKVHLVDLAGSERANATQATGIRLKEGANINRSLVTLGIVISTLADLSVGSGMKKKQNFVPYRDSVLTWLLKDSLGGNSKTIMIATISPADINYSETLNTLRYASRAKNILNKPTVNEDSNVKIIRELQAEIARLKALLSTGNQMMSFEQPSGSSVEERLHQDEARVQELTEQWANRWKEIHNILGEDTVALRKEGIGVVLDSEMPHLICIDEDRLSTGVVLYHLKEGRTSVGAGGTEPEQDIVLHGEALQKEHCLFENQTGTVTLVPLPGARCAINGVEVTQPYVLTQGVNIQLGKATMFHFNHPQEAAQLREKRKSGLFVSSNSTAFSVESFSHFSSEKVSDQPKSDGEALKSSCLSGESHSIFSTSLASTDFPQNNTYSSFIGPSESQHVPETLRALTEHCATNNPAGDAKSLGKSLQTSLDIQWEKQHSAPHKSETEAPSEYVTDKELEGEKTVVNGELWDTRVLQECHNGTSGFLDVEQQYLWHPFVGSEGSLLAEESHLQSRHSTTGGGAAFVPSLTCLEHFSQRHSPLTMGGQFSKHFLSRTSVESQEAKAQPEGSGFSSSLGSLVGRVSWMLADAGRVLTNTLKEQTGGRGSAWYNQMCSMVKDLPLVHHIQFELTLRPQAKPTLETTQFCRNLSHSDILSVREHSVALSSMQDLSRSSTGEWKSPLMALEATQTRDSVTTQRSEGLKVCCQRLHPVPESLLHLQNLPPQQLLSCLHSVIPAPLLMEERVFALYWLGVATCSQQDPQPAVTVIFQTKLLVITFDPLPDASSSTHSLNVYYELSFQQLQEIYIGFAGQTVRLTGNTENSILVLHTCNASLSQELSQNLLEVICPLDSGALDHPLLSNDMVRLSLNWDSHVKDLLLPSGGRLTCSFQKTLAKLVFLLHGNMQGERPALADVQLLFYTTVRFQRSSLKLDTNPVVPDSQTAPIDSELVQLVLTDTHLGLLRENAVYHPPPCSVAVVAHEAQFRLIDLRKRSDVRCMLVRDGYGSMCLDVVLAQKSGGTGGHSQPPEVCSADEAAAQSPTNSDSSPRNEVWKLTFSSSAEATFLINNLSNI
uniref:Kinesin family member 16Bb n=1 Tax=Cyprinus carpio TaxID=7962 RepID=A0A8C1WM23_CYPCA